LDANVGAAVVVVVLVVVQGSKRKLSRKKSVMGMAFDSVVGVE
jgi:hypothetical protein